MINNYKVSIIVTVHNSEKYLEKCLESVSSQTLRDIEILCIDGKSSDRSAEILLDFSKKDNRIKIINDDNASYGHKINIGIEKARGKYISILESDDQYGSFMLEKLYSIIEKYQLDYIDSDFYEFWEMDNKTFKYKRKKYKYKEEYDVIIDSGKCNKFSFSTGAVWTGLYNREFLLNKKIRLNESKGASYQDTSFGFQIGIYANHSYHLSEPLYYYRIDNDESSVKDNGKVFEIVYEFEYLEDCLKINNNCDYKIWEAYYKAKYSAFFWNAGRLSGSAREKFLKCYISELKKDVKKQYLKKELLSAEEYIFTYLLLDDYKEFRIKLEQYSKDRNNIHTITKMIEQIGKREIVIFGGGIWGEQIIELYCDSKDQIKCICDNSIEIEGKKIYGFNVLSVDDAVKMYPEAVYIIASRWHGKIMKEQIIKCGIVEKNIYIYRTDLFK